MELSWKVILLQSSEGGFFQLLHPCRREKAISACMVQSLFEEYQFFPRYPERELRITAVLFGNISLVLYSFFSRIKHQD